MTLSSADDFRQRAAHGPRPAGAHPSATDDVADSPMLRARALRVGHREALGPPIDIEIKPGTIILVRGENGAGKTTLIQTLAGALQPVDGQLEFAAGLSLVHLPQHAARLLPGPFSVGNLLALAQLRGEVHPWIPSDHRERLDRLSGGQRQRLVLAIACVQRCDLLLLDEPSQSLDAASRSTFFAELAGLGQLPSPAGFARARAIVVVSHDVEADRLLSRPSTTVVEVTR